MLVLEILKLVVMLLVVCAATAGAVAAIALYIVWASNRRAEECSREGGQ